jgi:hypothetical protein
MAAACVLSLVVAKEGVRSSWGTAAIVHWDSFLERMTQRAKYLPRYGHFKLSLS